MSWFKKKTVQECCDHKNKRQIEETYKEYERYRGYHDSNKTVQRRTYSVCESCKVTLWEEEELSYYHWIFRAIKEGKVPGYSYKKPVDKSKRPVKKKKKAKRKR